VADVAIVDNKSKVTKSQLRTFMELCWVKYVKARIEPGSSVLSTLKIPPSDVSSRLHCWCCGGPVNW
jgi:hypothetical protein